VISSIIIPIRTTHPILADIWQDISIPRVIVIETAYMSVFDHQPREGDRKDETSTTGQQFDL
jgi:hypothetical protein